MTFATCAIDLDKASFTDFGLSADAHVVRKEVNWFENRINDVSEYVYAYKKIHRELDEMLIEYRNPNWDGYGAASISKDSYFIAKQFINTLDEKWLSFEVNVDPDGEVSLDWCSDSGNVFAISISSNGKMSYAGKYGLSVKHGYEYFSNHVPSEIISCLERL